MPKIIKKRSESGKFSADGKEYIITDPRTPKPWVNYLTNGRYCTFMSHTGGGYTFWKDPFVNGITRWGPRLKSAALGREVYVLDKGEDDYWTINWEPVCRDYDSWECRVGLGYNLIKSERKEIGGSVLYFVPPDKDLEYWLIRIKNKSDEARELEVFTGVELSLGNIRSDLLSTEFHELFNRVYEEEGVLYAEKTFWDRLRGLHTANEKWPTKVFFACEPKANGFDCLKDAFIGDYRLASNPIAVEEGRCRNTESEGRSSVFAFQFSLDLKGGEEKEILVGMGVLKDILIERDLRLEVAKEEFKRLKSYWDGIINEGVVVETPDKNLDLSVNIWNKYQNRINFWWYRSAASYYLFGFDTFGFRDVAQTIIGTLPIDPELARERIKFITKFQFKDGNTCHSFSQVSMRGTRTDHTDVPMWYPLVVFCYLKETGDFDFLYEREDFMDSGKGTIYEHMKRAIDYVLSRRSERGLILIERGDWNDALDFVGKKGRGESVMASQMLYLVLDRWIKLNEFLEFPDVASRYKKEKEELKRAVNEYCWDGEWYIRAFKDDGGAIGCKTNEEGKIYLNTLSWAVFGKIAPADRADKCMDSVERYLETDYGTALFRPAYSHPDRSIGLITRFISGEKENGAIFMHASAWSIIAAALSRRGNKAYEYYKKTLPLNLASNPAFKTEPYVYPEYVAGPDSPHYGEGSHSWLTGSAAWMWRACVDYILGVRTELDGLKIDPCIPSEWTSYKIKRRFRNAIYDISVSNPKGVQHGVREIRIDGEKYESNILPVYADGRIHRVEVIMGEE